MCTQTKNTEVVSDKRQREKKRHSEFELISAFLCSNPTNFHSGEPVEARSRKAMPVTTSIL